MTYSRTTRAAGSATLLAGAFGAAFLPGTVLASEEASPEGPRIIVTGQRAGDANPNANPNAPYKVEQSADGRFTEEVRDTPKSITIIPKEVIEDVGATTFRELARTTPGVTLGTGEGGNAFGDRIFIRGFEARNDIYIDGQRDPGVTSREIFAVEQVEIIKGPSSAYLGRGTTGGSVGLQSKRAQSGNDFVVAEGTVGTDNFYRATVDANYELAPDVGLRVNGLYHSSDVPGRDYVDSERYGIAAALGWRPVDRLAIGLDYYHYRSDGMSDYGHPFDPATGEPYDVDPDNFYGAVGRDFLQNDADIATLLIRFDPSDSVSIQSQTRYGEVDNRYVVSVPRAPRAADPANNSGDAAEGFIAGQLVVDTGTPQRNATTEYLGNITTATATAFTGGIEHAIVAGGEVSREKITNRRYAFPDLIEDENGDRIATPGGFTLDLFDPDPVLGFEIPAVLDTTAIPVVTEVDSASFFLIDTIKFSPQWELLLGLRYDTFEVTSTGESRGTPFDVSGSYDFLNYQASLLYKPVEAVSLYASFSTSSNPSGEQLDATSPTYGGGVGVTDLEPERNKAYEVGAKVEVAGGDLLLTGAAFRIDKENARESLGGGQYALVGEQRSQGIELGANGNLTSRLAVFAGYTYLDSEIVDSVDPDAIGQPFANVPEHTFSGLVSYAVTNDFTIGGQAFYRSRIFGGSLEANDNSVPGYWKFDAVARLDLTERVQLRANVLNIFDERYYDAIYRSGSPFSYIAPGRSATLSVTLEL